MIRLAWTWAIIGLMCTSFYKEALAVESVDSIVIRVGKSLRLDCFTNKTLGLEWRLNNHTLSINNRIQTVKVLSDLTLKIEPVVDIDGGVYSCIQTHDGTILKKVKVTTQLPAENPVCSADIQDNDTVGLKCTSTVIGDTLSWVESTQNKTTKICNATECLYSVTSVEFSFLCRTWNGFGLGERVCRLQSGKTSPSTTLTKTTSTTSTKTTQPTITKPILIIRQYPASVTIKDDSVTFICEVPTNYTIQWRFKGSKVLNNSKVEEVSMEVSSTGTRFTLRNLQPHVNGSEVKCTAMFQGDKQEASTILFLNHVPVSITGSGSQTESLSRLHTILYILGAVVGTVVVILFVLFVRKFHQRKSIDISVRRPNTYSNKRVVDEIQITSSLSTVNTDVDTVMLKQAE